MNIPAIYHYKTWDYSNERYLEYDIKCEVVDTSKTQYKIKLLEFTKDRKPGDYLWVKKHNIRVTGPDKDSPPLSSMDYDDFEEPWWNKI